MYNSLCSSGVLKLHQGKVGQGKKRHIEETTEGNVYANYKSKISLRNPVFESKFNFTVA